ncbi:MAG: tetratricopeptide repeat protein [Minisyncoccia bacterium]
MKNRVYFLIFFFSLIFSSSGQCSTNLDSLIKSLEHEINDTNKINIINNIACEFSFSNPQKSLEYAEQQLSLAKNARWEKGISNAYYNIGNANYALGNYPAALEYWLKDLQKRIEFNDRENMSKAMANIGAVYQDLGNYAKALEYDIKALKLAEEIGNKENVVLGLCNIACVHKDLGYPEKSLEYYFKSLKLAEEIGYKNLIAINLGNIGGVYQDKGNYTMALEYYFKALKIDEQLGNKRNVASWLSNIGDTYLLQNNSEIAVKKKKLNVNLSSKALDYYFRAFKHLKELGDNGLQSIILKNIGNIYIEKGNYIEAEEYLQEAIELATKTNSINEIMEDHSCFYKLYKKNNSPAKALYHYEKYVALKDSLFNKNNKRIISELQIKYETEKKEIENKSLIQQNKIQALSIINNRYLIIGLVGFLLLILSIWFLLYRQNKLKSQQLSAQFEQKLLRTQMNPHFIFNSLACIESFIYDHQPKEAGVYLSKFSRLMRLILENSASELISLDKEIEILNYYLSLQKLRLDDNLYYSIEIAEKIIPEQIFLPPMLMQPFIENSIEHGFRGRKQKGEIQISFYLIKNNLSVQIIDNGIGIEQAQQQKELHNSHKSMAMEITLERLKLLNKKKKKKLSFTMTDIGNKDKGHSGTEIIFSIPI